MEKKNQKKKGFTINKYHDQISLTFKKTNSEHMFDAFDKSRYFGLRSYSVCAGGGRGAHTLVFALILGSVGVNERGCVGGVRVRVCVCTR